jgi:hypothetical protein
MKKIVFPALLLAVSAACSLQANLITNGDFEAGPSEERDYSFGETPGWWNRAKREEPTRANARRNYFDDGGFNAIVNDRGETFSSFNQKTQHAIQEGDEFEISLDLKAGMDWENVDGLKVVIFATATDTLGGSIVWEETVNFESGYGNAWITETHTFPPAPADVQGRTLFLYFHGFDNAESRKTGFLRVDNIVLTVKPKADAASPLRVPD